MKSYAFDRLSLGLAFFIFAAPVSAIDSMQASLKIDALVEEELKKNGLILILLRAMLNLLDESILI